MLIDSTHRRWMIGTIAGAGVAVGVYLLLERASSVELTGGSVVGLWYGIVGALLIVYAGLLAAHRKLLRWRILPSRATMLKGHIWLGLLSAVFLLCHSGFRWGGLLERALWVVFALTLATGVFGLWLQQFVPRLLATRFGQETPYEQIPYYCQVLRSRADTLVDGLCGPENAAAVKVAPKLAENAGSRVRAAYERHIRPFLDASTGGRLDQAASMKAVVAELASMPEFLAATDELTQLLEICAERRQLREQEKLCGWLHGWLLLHVPLSILLLILGVAHAVGSLYY